VFERCDLAMLDGDFACRVARWPQVAACLLDRAVERSRVLAFQQLASHLPHLESRLMALLWMLADRWGRVTPDGVLLPIRLTHSTLAELVGASRPSVSSTLKLLERSGLLERNGGGSLLHRQAPPALLDAIGAGRVTARPGGRARPSRGPALRDAHR
jgi:CRP/FNR family transcriptional regulator, cyclic AMP receptor protein